MNRSVTFLQVLGVWLALVASGWTAEPSIDQATAIAQIEKLGGKVAIDETRPGNPVIWVSFLGPEVTDAHLGSLKGLTSLESLNLVWTRVTDTGLACVKEMTKLQSMNMHGTPITDAALEHFKVLTELEALDLYGTQVNGSGLAHLKGLTRLNSLGLGATKLTDAGLEHLRWFTQLHSLDLIWTGTSDAGLRQLAGLTTLQSLNLYGTQITDSGLEHLKGLTDLRSLNLTGDKITDSGLEHLKGLTNLQSLELQGTKVNGVGLKYLKGLAKLTSLNLSFSQVGDAGLKHLEAMTNLQSLSLSWTSVADAGTKHLRGLTNLQSLNLSKTQVSDKGLDELTGLTKLRTLDLTNIKIGHASVKKLQKALPRCWIGYLAEGRNEKPHGTVPKSDADKERAEEARAFLSKFHKEEWGYRRLTETADTVVVATLESSKEGPYDLYQGEMLKRYGKNTMKVLVSRFDVAGTIKGKDNGSGLEVVHAVFKAELVNQKVFPVAFSKTKTLPAGMVQVEMDGRVTGYSAPSGIYTITPEYLLFLKTRQDGRYELVDETGEQSVKILNLE